MRPFRPLAMTQLGPPCTWDPDEINSTGTGPGGGSVLDPTKLIMSSNGQTACIGTVGKSSGLFYFEATYTGSGAIGSSASLGLSPHSIGQLPTSLLGASGKGVGYYANGSVKGRDSMGSTISGYAPAWALGDVIGIAADLTHDLWWPRHNGVFVGDPVARTGGLALLNTLYFPAGMTDADGHTQSLTLRFSSFSAPAPTGYRKWR